MLPSRWILGFRFRVSGDDGRMLRFRQAFIVGLSFVEVRCWNVGSAVSGFLLMVVRAFQGCDETFRACPSPKHNGMRNNAACR